MGWPTTTTSNDGTAFAESSTDGEKVLYKKRARRVYMGTVFYEVKLFWKHFYIIKDNFLAISALRQHIIYIFFGGVVIYI